jgi:putative ABC transport system substrate-binding protein
MRRRDFVGGLGLVAAVPLAARGQQSKVYRVGLLLGATRESAAPLFHALKEGLRERGYVEGRNIEFVQRYGDGKMERLPMRRKWVSARMLLKHILEKRPSTRSAIP